MTTLIDTNDNSPTHRWVRSGALVRIVDNTPGWKGLSRYNPPPSVTDEPEYDSQTKPFGGCHHVRVSHNHLILVEVKTGNVWMRRPLHPDELEVIA